MRHLVLLLVLTSLEARSQEMFQETPTRVKEIKFENLKSSYGQEYFIYINLPDSYATSADTYPVFYILDPDVYFIGATNIYKKLVEEKLLNESIVVGIGYGNQPKAKRFMDYSPTYQKEYPGSGNSENFRKFIEDDLFPLINKKYRTNDVKTIYGHSLGGLLSCYVLFTKPTMFNNYIISSPTLNWDNGTIFSYEENYYSKNKILNAKVFFSVADEKDLKKELDKLIDKLNNRNYKELRIKREDFPTNTHQTVQPNSLIKGLRFIFSVD